MSYHYHPSIGTFHLSTSKGTPLGRRVVPAGQRHKWSCIPKRGEAAICLKCACVKTYGFDYETRYLVPGARLADLARPNCTGSPTPTL